MSEKIGKLYTDAEVNHAAKCRAEEDSKHEWVIWGCRKCRTSAQTLVSQKKASRQCDCGYWMEWSYRPLSEVA
jgi:hypothetical protein